MKTQGGLQYDILTLSSTEDRESSGDEEDVNAE